MRYYSRTTKYIAETAQKQPMRGVTRFIVVHHAAFTYPRGSAVKSIFNYHSKKWPKYGRIGYQIVLQEELDGTIARWDVNPLSMQGANVAKRNHECIGICAATNFTGMPPDKWYYAIVAVVKRMRLLYPTAQVVGHKDIAVPEAPTACPGPLWPQWRPILLRDVGVLP